MPILGRGSRLGGGHYFPGGGKGKEASRYNLGKMNADRQKSRRLLGFLRKSEYEESQ